MSSVRTKIAMVCAMALVVIVGGFRFRSRSVRSLPPKLPLRADERREAVINYLREKRISESDKTTSVSQRSRDWYGMVVNPTYPPQIVDRSDRSLELQGETKSATGQVFLVNPTFPPQVLRAFEPLHYAEWNKVKSR